MEDNKSFFDLFGFADDEEKAKELLRKAEERKPLDLFKSEVVEIEGNITNVSFSKKPNFGRYPTFEEDLLEFRKKWYGKPQEVLVQHMIDSLIIFNHNMGNLIGAKFKIRNLEELKKIN